MHVDEKSDSVVVPTKLSNKEGVPSAEMVEGRTLPKGNSDQETAVRTQSRVATSNVLMAVRRTRQTRCGYEVPDASPPCAVDRSDAVTWRRSPVR